MSSATEQAYKKAETEYDEVKTKLKRLDDLRRGIAQEDFEGERKELEDGKKTLEKEKKSWGEQVQLLQQKLLAVLEPGNDFVSQVLGHRLSNMGGNIVVLENVAFFIS